MKAALLLALLVISLVVWDSAEGWGRRWRRRFRVRFRVRWGKVNRFLKDHKRRIQFGLAAARMLGKRSADNPPPDNRGMDRDAALQMLQGLDLACASDGINGLRLSRKTVMDVFDKVDRGSEAVGDGDLDDGELGTFEKVLDAFRACADKDKIVQKAQQ